MNKRSLLGLCIGILMALVACSGAKTGGQLESVSQGRPTRTPAPTSAPLVALLPISSDNINQLQTLSAWVGRGDWISYMSFTPDSQKLLTYTSNNATFHLYDLASGTILYEVQTANPQGWSSVQVNGGRLSAITSAAMSADGQLLATTGSANVIQIWSVATGAELKTLSSPSEETFSLQFSPDNRFIALAYGNGNFEIRDLESDTVTLQGSYRRGWSGIYSLAYSPDGAILVAAHAGNSLTVWDTATGERLDRLTEHNSDVNFVTFSADGRWLLSTSGDNSAIIWDTERWESVSYLRQSNDVPHAAFSPTGEMLGVTNQDGILRLYSLNDAGREDGRLDSNEIFSSTESVTDGTLWITSVAFSLDGQKIAYSNSVGDIRILGVVDAN